MNIQSCVCVTPWVWRGFYWIQGTLYEIADQTYCQDTVLELCWQHWKWEITQISIWEEDNQQCNLSVRLHQPPSPCSMCCAPWNILDTFTADTTHLELGYFSTTSLNSFSLTTSKNCDISSWTSFISWLSWSAAPTQLITSSYQQLLPLRRQTSVTYWGGILE